MKTGQRTTYFNLQHPSSQTLSHCIILQVERSWETWFEANSYYVVIGPNVDIAFICICAFAIDELFCDDGQH